MPDGYNDGLAATPPAPALHPDDGHAHSFGCRLCGVDSPPVPALDYRKVRRQIEVHVTDHEDRRRLLYVIDGMYAALAPERQDDPNAKAWTRTVTDLNYRKVPHWQETE